VAVHVCMRFCVCMCVFTCAHACMCVFLYEHVSVWLAVDWLAGCQLVGRLGRAGVEVGELALMRAVAMGADTKGGRCSREAKLLAPCRAQLRRRQRQYSAARLGPRAERNACPAPCRPARR
jgi:hypothetical protein